MEYEVDGGTIHVDHAVAFGALAFFELLWDMLFIRGSNAARSPKKDGTRFQAIEID
jgi:hypothetical protein